VAKIRFFCELPCRYDRDRRSSNCLRIPRSDSDGQRARGRVHGSARRQAATAGDNCGTRKCPIVVSPWSYGNRCHAAAAMLLFVQSGSDDAAVSHVVDGRRLTGSTPPALAAQSVMGLSRRRL
jgi:hypothetical protein